MPSWARPFGILVATLLAGSCSVDRQGRAPARYADAAVSPDAFGIDAARPDARPTDTGPRPDADLPDTGRPIPDAGACPGGCGGGETCCAGTCTTCDDGEPCTDDWCDPMAGCQHTRNTAPCDDGEVCTDPDVCSAGVCGGPTVDCRDGNLCTDDFCEPGVGCQHPNNSRPCDDARFCTDGDTCMDGACRAGPPRDCSGAACSCSESEDRCRHASGGDC